MPGKSPYKELEGGPGFNTVCRSNGFNDCDRKVKREKLYFNVEQILKDNDLLPYDSYWVFNLLIKQIRNGEI